MIIYLLHKKGRKKKKKSKRKNGEKHTDELSANKYLGQHKPIKPHYRTCKLVVAQSSRLYPLSRFVTEHEATEGERGLGRRRNGGGCWLAA